MHIRVIYRLRGVAVGKTYEAFTRFEKEALQRNLSLEDQPHAPDLSAASPRTEVNTFPSTDIEQRLYDNEKIYNIIGSESTKRDLISKLNVGTIRDIFSYNYFLKLSDPIRVRQINIFKYKLFVFYGVFLDTKIRVSIYLDRVGALASVNISPESQAQIKEHSAIRHGVFDYAGFKKAIDNMIQQIFISVDPKTLESFFIDLFAIENFQNISCERGDIVSSHGQLLYEITLKSDVSFSLLLNPIGNFIGITFSKDPKTWKQILCKHFSEKSSFGICLFNN